MSLSGFFRRCLSSFFAFGGEMAAFGGVTTLFGGFDDPERSFAPRLTLSR
jgi:hypothetical protein